MSDKYMQRLKELGLVLDKLPALIGALTELLNAGRDKQEELLLPLRPEPALKQIRRFVVAWFGVTLEEITGKARPTRVVWPRQVGMYLMRGFTDESFDAIGEQFKRDHGSVMNACDKVASDYKIYANVRAQVDEMRGRIEAKLKLTWKDPETKKLPARPLVPLHQCDPRALRGTGPESDFLMPRGRDVTRVASRTL